MALPVRSKGMSKATRALLAQGEGERVDFKRAADGISQEDLVSFANTASGGTILIGIDEILSVNGITSGSVRGCDVSDGAFLQILNKAVSCIPPVKVQFYIENTSNKPIGRIEIDPSVVRPHCTAKGIYCIRDGSRNRPLHPGELLTIFLEIESNVFASRFEDSAQKISSRLSELEKSLSDSIESMGTQLGWAEYKLGDTESTLDSIFANVRMLGNKSDEQSERLRTIFRQDGREDPVKQRSEKEFIAEIVDQLSKDPKIVKHVQSGGQLSVSATGKAARELNEEEVKLAFSKALDIVVKRDEPKPL